MDLFKGTVKEVTDGDTLVVHVLSTGFMNRGSYGPTERVRLANVNAPELGSAGGAQARERLSRRLLGRRITVRVRARDDYGRVVGDVSLD